MASNLKTLRYLSFSHVALAILAVITGIASVNVTDYYFGVFGMGIWLGSWVCIEYMSELSYRNILIQLYCETLAVRFNYGQL